MTDRARLLRAVYYDGFERDIRAHGYTSKDGRILFFLDGQVVCNLQVDNVLKIEELKQ